MTNIIQVVYFTLSSPNREIEENIKFHKQFSPKENK